MLNLFVICDLKLSLFRVGEDRRLDARIPTTKIGYWFGCWVAAKHTNLNLQHSPLLSGFPMTGLVTSQ